jgi:serine/threonine-protein kinase
MAPEVAVGEESIDGRVDIYCLGCVGYFLLTGSPVFDEKTAIATTMAHVQKTPVPPSQHGELPIPAQLENLILRCLAKRPELRPQSALELRRLLATITGVPEWNQESAERWWQTYMPVSCSPRTAGQPRPVAAEIEPQHAEAGADGVTI